MIANGAKRLFALLAVLLIAVTLCSCGNSGSGSGGGTPEETEAAPYIKDPDYAYKGDGYSGFPSLVSFTAKTLDGSPFSPEDLASKDITVINVWATWCAPCLNELPDLAAFSRMLPDNIGFITICADGTDDRDNTRSILAKAGYEGETIVTGTGSIGNLLASCMYVPTTVFVDKDGTVRNSTVGSPRSNLAGYYLGYLNDALTAAGCDPIDLPGVEIPEDLYS